jgi:integrase
MRRREQLSLQRNDIKRKIATLRMTKNGKARHVPLSSRALACLPELPEKGRLFRYNAGQLRHMWSQTCRDARVSDLHWHDLRHEAVSRLFERGLTTEEVMSVSGHRTYANLFRYTHLRPSSVLDKLG